MLGSTQEEALKVLMRSKVALTAQQIAEQIGHRRGPIVRHALNRLEKAGKVTADRTAGQSTKWSRVVKQEISKNDFPVRPLPSSTFTF